MVLEHPVRAQRRPGEGAHLLRRAGMSLRTKICGQRRPLALPARRGRCAGGGAGRGGAGRGRAWRSVSGGNSHCLLLPSGKRSSTTHGDVAAAGDSAARAVGACAGEPWARGARGKMMSRRCRRALVGKEGGERLRVGTCGDGAEPDDPIENRAPACLPWACPAASAPLASCADREGGSLKAAEELCGSVFVTTQAPLRGQEQQGGAAPPVRAKFPVDSRAFFLLAAPLGLHGLQPGSALLRTDPNALGLPLGVHRASQSL